MGHYKGHSLLAVFWESGDVVRPLYLGAHLQMVSQSKGLPGTWDEAGGTSASPTPSRSDCPSIAKVGPRAMGLCQDCQGTCEGHSPQGVQPRAPISPYLLGSLYSLLKSPFKCHFFRESAIFHQSNCLLVTPAHSILYFPMMHLSQL